MLPCHQRAKTCAFSLTNFTNILLLATRQQSTKLLRATNESGAAMVWIPVVSRGRRLAISCWKHPQLHYKLGGQGRHSRPAVRDVAEPKRKRRRARIWDGSPESFFFFFFLPSRGPQTFVLYICAFAFMKGNLGGGAAGGLSCHLSVLSVRARPQSLSSIQIFGLSARAAVCGCSCLSLCFNRLTPGFPPPRQRHSNSSALIPAAFRCVTDCSVSP